MFGLSAALYLRCTKTGSGGKFCVVSDSLMCGSLTLAVMCHCVGLGTWYLGTGYLLSKTSSTMH